MAYDTEGGVTRTVTLHHRGPFQSGSLLAFLAPRATPGVEEVQDTAYRRSIRSGSGHAIVSLTLVDASSFSLTTTSASADSLDVVVAAARRFLDLDADPAIIDRHLFASPLLRRLVERRPGLRVPGTFGGFELGVRAILGQQVSVAAATTMTGRLVDIAGRRIAEAAGTIRSLFPSPDDVAEADLSSLGVPRKRSESIRAFAAAVATGELSLDGSMANEVVRDRLLAVPGIGPWTTKYIAMRALRDPDAFPDTDLGIRRALERLDADGSPRLIAEQWRPWRSYAAMHLWTSLSAE